MQNIFTQTHFKTDLLDLQFTSKQALKGSPTFYYIISSRPVP